MKTYVSHKRVKAAQIVSVGQVDATNGSRPLALDDGENFTATHPMCQRYEPKTGDYLVEYDDGYRSISPKHAFEDGYTEVDL